MARKKKTEAETQPEDEVLDVGPDSVYFAYFAYVANREREIDQVTDSPWQVRASSAEMVHAYQFIFGLDLEIPDGDLNVRAAELNYLEKLQDNLRSGGIDLSAGGVELSALLFFEGYWELEMRKRRIEERKKAA